MPVPQENSSLVERAGEPVLENGARCELQARTGSVYFPLQDGRSTSLATKVGTGAQIRQKPY
ncbi:hypothetical protein [Microcoleus sp. D2_18a_B4]|uniref:hypothetical protein n=1 Tax=Microcoleus sp. D2_18a_B4 TaxID=3055329 RepID=UPI002FD66ACF